MAAVPVPVPVTLVTGFLGAGKSSLVAHVLANKAGRRVAVVVNEFGAGLGIDSAMVSDTCVAARRAATLLTPRAATSRSFRSLWSCPTAAYVAL